MAPLTNGNAPAPAVYLVAIDTTSAASHVLEVACGLGAALGGAAELHILHVIGVTQPVAAMGAAPIGTPTDVLEGGRTVLDRACAEAATRFQGRIAGHLAAGDPWREIVQMASSLRADLVVVGTAGKTGLARMALGSVAESVVRHAGCPVLVVRPKDYHARVVPEIEPPCPDCTAIQNETSRAQLWCARHSAHHSHGRLHYEVPKGFAEGSMLIRT
jgi:nucleotide-binding universal stress UspA family protein